MQKEQLIAIASGVIVVFGVFGLSALGNPFGITMPFSTEFEKARDTAPSSEDTPDAWETFERYLSAAKSHNLPLLRRLSYQLSSACQRPVDEEECFRLMDSVVFFASEFEKANFIHSESDARQTVLYTDYTEGTRILLYFTHAEQGAPTKVLGIRFCAEGTVPFPACFDDVFLSRQDSDLDGWWDSTETLLR